jgi:hypothetical protein
MIQGDWPRIQTWSMKIFHTFCPNSKRKLWPSIEPYPPKATTNTKTATKQENNTSTLNLMTMVTVPKKKVYAPFLSSFQSGISSSIGTMSVSSSTTKNEVSFSMRAP